MIAQPTLSRRGFALSAGAALLLAGCATTPSRPPAPAAGGDRLTLTPTAFDLLPGWHDDAVAQVLPALRRSCQHVAQLPSGQVIGADGQGGLAADWLGPCGAVRPLVAGDDDGVREYFETWFQPHRATTGGHSDGLFTGYYEAELHGSRRPSSRYCIPLYGRPSGLPANPEPPYLTRAEIEAGALRGKAPELLWVDDPVDAHILQIQGSGRVILDDGTVVRVGYNGSNGHEFLGLGRILMDHGKLGRGETTMPAIRAWLKGHPAEAQTLMAENQRYVFFRLIDGDGPVGAAGVPLTPGRSLAVDTRFVPLGVPLWLDTTDPDGRALRRLMVAQDTGKAIKGPVRGDVFWGSGEPAFDKAGRMHSPGTYYLLLPRQHSGLFALAMPDGGRL